MPTFAHLVRCSKGECKIEEDCVVAYRCPEQVASEPYNWIARACLEYFKSLSLPCMSRASTNISYSSLPFNKSFRYRSVSFWQRGYH